MTKNMFFSVNPTTMGAAFPFLAAAGLVRQALETAFQLCLLNPIFSVEFPLELSFDLFQAKMFMPCYVVIAIM